VKLWVRVDELRKVGAADARAEPKAEVRGPAKVESPPNDRNTLDVRGMRVDDALAMMESFLDRMFGSAEPVAYVLHGVGSGALRDAIREHLGCVGQGRDGQGRVAQYVARSRPGAIEEGGERVTAVYLR
jgi:DNA mismatch repair protein MutS2